MKPEGGSLPLSPCGITHLYGVLRRRQQSPPTAVVTYGSGDKGPGFQRDAFRSGRQKEEVGGGKRWAFFGAAEPEQSDAGAGGEAASAAAFPFPCLSFSSGKIIPGWRERRKALQKKRFAALSHIPGGTGTGRGRGRSVPREGDPKKGKGKVDASKKASKKFPKEKKKEVWLGVFFFVSPIVPAWFLGPAAPRTPPASPTSHPRPGWRACCGASCPWCWGCCSGTPPAPAARAGRAASARTSPARPAFW